ncbi:cystathionine gamma-synthase [Paraferrimonas haliotis]|uniref:O-succinylhomoserine (Thiol)-lyase n=1 Tax=Paraferrimonas haliotis TaxID=2013866 RepID=A0AA37TME6_9GAMM|nr:cystathionine gamma-synthase [Paraferrimonas haliotis]GLS82313.1 O-succinylhomoserine (thiol)-lyase [Paraferrimonas haliotis]
MTKYHPGTIAVREGIEDDTHHGAVVPPIYLSTNYTFEDYHTPRDFDYSRSGNPTRNILANALTKLEQGAGGVVTSTGMAAINVVLQLLSPGDRLVVPHDCYGGSFRLFTNLARKGYFELDVVDQTDAQALAQCFARKPTMVWLETPSNPLLRVVDIAAVAQQCQASNSLLVVDNTFLSPVLQKPLTLGADIVIHSTTKFINGHSDVVGGAVVAKTDELAEQLDWWANTIGATGSAFDSYLTLRGLRTLEARVNQHQANALKVAALLDAHPAVDKTYFPGFEYHSEHHIAKRQQQGFGSMISFELKGDDQHVGKLLSALTLFSVAESLGGVESLVAVPATMTHRAMEPEARAEAGLKDTLIRLSVGIENGDDLVADLQQALDALV